MADPTITCPKCKTEIKLNESLAAPLIEATRLEYEQQLKQKDTDIAKRETSLKEREVALSKAQKTIDDQVTEKLRVERTSIAIEEAQKAKLALGADLDQKSKEVIELQEVLKQRDVKLAEAQQAQAGLIRKQRELDDAKREFELTVEKRVQAGLEGVRDQARKEVEEGLKFKPNFDSLLLEFSFYRRDP